MDQSALFSQPPTRTFTLSKLTSREAAGDHQVITPVSVVVGSIKGLRLFEPGHKCFFSEGAVS